MAKNFFGITDTGMLRDNNEDTFIAETVLDNQFILACVIDGVGGYSGGEVAARLAHDAILNHLRTPSADIIRTMQEAVAAANDSIYKEKQQSKQNDQMACVLTLALADVANNKFYYAHVGDTRLYLLRDSSLVKVTRDHSFVGFLEDSGRLSEEAAMKHPKRNEINKALGFDTQINGQADYIETGDSPFLPGDVLLLCSDGLTDMISNSTMTAILNSDKSLSAQGKALIQAANDAGGKDNITAVLVHNNKPPLKQRATKPIVAALKKKSDNEDQEDHEYNDELLKAEAKTKPIIIEKVNRRSSRAVPILLFLCLLFLGAFLWMLYKDFFQAKPQKDYVQMNMIDSKRNEQEQKLLDSINNPASNEVFVINVAGGKPVVISDTLTIEKDSLHIIGNGVTLVRDSAYKGPALALSSNCKYVLLDSLTIENFDVGVLVRNKALQFKNVQFKNCRVPVQYQVMFADSGRINGRFADTIFYNIDTLTLTANPR
jgi:serine/threonine protein phosphatase PrpC